MSVHGDDAFLAAYNRLNIKQKQAVDTIEGPVMVIAGPGTGKTQILTLRIAQILRQTQMNPENILALTFTKSGVKAMRERLFRFIGPAAYRVGIYTFHGLAEKLIKDYPDAYTKIVGGTPVTEIEKIDIIETILATPDLGLLRPKGAPQFYVTPVIAMISQMKQENITPDGLAELILTQEEELANIPQYHEKGAHRGKERSEYTKTAANIEKQRALLIVYRQYEALMRERARYDFDDMMVETVRVLQMNESLRLDLQETYQYILADEHQDVNGAQNEILVQLTSYHDHPNLFVVGDEKQAIYRFQGASLENFLYFETLFPRTTVIVLTDNYRSTQPILDAAHSLVAVTEGPLLDYRLPLQSQQSNSSHLQLSPYATEQAEHAALVAQVKSVLAQGIPPEEIAVIVRSNREVEVLADELGAAGIPVEASADSDILEHPLFLAILDLLEAVLHPSDEVVLARVLEAPYWGISAADIVRIMAARSYDRPLSACLEDHDYLLTLGIVSTTAILHFTTVISTARTKQLLLPPHRLLASLVTESGLLPQVISEEPTMAARIIRRLYDEVEGLVRNNEATSLSAVVTLLRRRISYRIPLAAPFLRETVAAVQVMTAHKAKGLEFTVVCIPHLHEGAWGANTRPLLFRVPLVRSAVLQLEANEDERRLLYVAMTRAKTTLYLSYAQQSSDGKVLLPSMFLNTFTTLVPTTSAPAVVVQPVVPPRPVLTQDFLAVRELLLVTLRERGLSATSLNNCIKNPWHYFYRNVVRIPEVQTLALLFGTALHSVLEELVKQHTATGTVPDFSIARSVLERALGRLPLSTVEFADLFQKGQEVLVAYLPHLAETISPFTKTEVAVKVQFATQHLELPMIPLTGKLDRIDFATPEKALRVVDYKTGKPKTRNDIEGKTAKGDASYRRQLSFYSLLLSLYDDERYCTDTGVLSFIEPDSRGVIHEEVFTSGTAEREALTSLINEVVATIVSGEFLRDEALLAASDYAHMGRLLFERLTK